MPGGSRHLRSPYRHSLAVTLDLTGNLHAVATTLGGDPLPVPATVPAPISAALRHFAAGMLILLKAYVNGAIEAVLPKDGSGPTALPA